MATVFGLAAFNEEASIDPLFTRLREMHSSAGPIVVVIYNDGSQDGTRSKVHQWRDRLDIRYLEGDVNKGLAFGVASLVEYFVANFTDGDYLVLMDCDDTHDPAQVQAMLAQANDETVVIASRYQPGSAIHGLSRFRRLASRVFSTMAQGYFHLPNVRDYTSGFRLYPYPVLSQVLEKGLWPTTREFGFAVTPELLIRCGAANADFAEIPMNLGYDRKSSASNMRVAHNAINLVKLIPKWRGMLKSRNRSRSADE